MSVKSTHRTLAVRATVLAAILIFSIIAVPVAVAAPAESSLDPSTTSAGSQSITTDTNHLAISSGLPMQVSAPAVERDGVDAALRSGGVHWSGQELGVTIPESVTDADTIELRRHSGSDARAGSFVREFGLDDDRSLTIRTAQLDGTYVLVPDGDRSQALRIGSDGVAADVVAPDNAQFEVAKQSLRVEWSQDRITTSDDDVSLDIRSNRARYNLKVSADGLDYDDLENLFRAGGAASNPDPYADRNPFAVDGVVHDAHADDDELVIRGVRDGSLTADFTQIDPGSYSFTFEVTDTGVTSGAPVGDEEAGEDAPEVDPDPAFFELTDLDPESATVAPGDQFTVSATVTNVGGVDDSQTVALRIDNETITTEEVSLEPDGSNTVSFDVEAPDEPGAYIHSVHTADSNVFGNLTVESPETEDDPEPEPEPETDDDAPGFGVLAALVALIAGALVVIRQRR